MSPRTIQKSMGGPIFPLPALRTTTHSLIGLVCLSAGSMGPLVERLFRLFPEATCVLLSGLRGVFRWAARDSLFCSRRAGLATCAERRQRLTEVAAARLGGRFHRS